jgi:aspartyl aminopeptidase
MTSPQRRAVDPDRRVDDQGSGQPSDRTSGHSVDPTDDLCNLISASPSPYHAADEVTRRLVQAGFDERSPGDDLPGDGPVVVRSEGLVVAWCRRGQPADAPLRVVGAHTDSPNLRVRPQPDRSVAGWRQLGVEVYGGALLNSWLDRDLGLSGRVALRASHSGDGIAERTEASVGAYDAGVGRSARPERRPAVQLRHVRWDRPLLRVPQLAIHLDRDISSDGLQLNKQQHLTPVWGIGHSSPGEFRAWIADELGVDGDDVLSWDLMTHDLTPPARLGQADELLAAPRLDNLCSSWAGTTALIEAAGRDPADLELSIVPVLVLADHEEVGSTSGVGAASSLIVRLLEGSIRAAGGDDRAVQRALATSVIASVDMAHATHPNYPDRHEPGHPITPGGGPALKVNSNQRYASDARTIAHARLAAERAGVALQTYSHRGDLPCGSTIGPTLAASLGVGVVDLGAPQLSMHSARELMAVADVEPLAKLLAAWFG